MSSKFKKYLILLGGGLLILGAIFVVALPSLVSSELVRSSIEQELSEFAGRPVSLRGNVRISLFPSPVATFGNVSIPSANPDDDPFLFVENVNADISWVTLLSTNPTFTRFKLERPKLRLKKGADGTLNWRDGLGKIATATEAARRSIEAQKSNGSNAKPLLVDGFSKRLGQILVSGGSVEVVNPANEIVFQTTAIEGLLDWQRLDSSLSLDGKGVVKGIPAQLKIVIDQPLALLAGKLSNLSVGLLSELVSMNFDGSIGAFDHFFADGIVALNVASMGGTAEWIGASISPQWVFKTGKLDAKLKISSSKAQFENLKIGLNSNEGMGVLEFAVNKDGPDLLSGTLDFKELNLDDFVGAFVTLPWQSKGTAPLLDFALLPNIRTDLRVSASKAFFENVLLSNIAATAQVSKTNANLDIGDAQAYGGNVQISLQLQQETEAALLSVSAQNINLQQFGAQNELPATLPFGTATLNFTATSPISAWSKMISNASGKTTLKIENGITRGFGIKRLLSAVDGDQFFTLSGQGSTDENFKALSLSGNVNDGVISIEDGQIDYAEGAVQFQGVAPYGSGGIALTATALPAGSSAAAAAANAPETPVRRFFIGGSWERAFASPLPPSVAPLGPQ